MRRSGPSGARSRAGLTEAKIISAALALIDARGLSAFSMRALGRALGTSAMAIYFHFPAKGELLAALGRSLAASASLAAASADDPRARARAVLAQLRAVHAAHPNAYGLVRAELSGTAVGASPRIRDTWAALWPGLSPARANLLRVLLVAAATESPALDQELLSLFFG